MREHVLTIAVVALLALGASGVVAASMETPNADTPSADASPANYTVDVTNPDAVSDDVERAITTAWANDSVRSYVDDGAAVEFEIWAPALDDETVHVKVAPGDAPDDTRVVASVDLDDRTVTSVEEPVTLTTSNAVSLNATEYDIVSADGDELELDRDEERGDEGEAKLPADSVSRVELTERSISRGGGAFTVHVGGEGQATADAAVEDIFRIDLSSVELGDDGN